MAARFDKQPGTRGNPRSINGGVLLAGEQGRGLVQEALIGRRTGLRREIRGIMLTSTGRGADATRYTQADHERDRRDSLRTSTDAESTSVYERPSTPQRSYDHDLDSQASQRTGTNS